MNKDFNKKILGRTIITVIYIGIVFIYKYSSTLFLDYYQLDDRIGKFNIGKSISISKFFIYLVFSNMIISYLYKVSKIKNYFDKIIGNSILRDPD